MYLVIEIQVSGGVMSQIATAYDNRADAESKYHAVLSVAAKSGLDSHACVILDRAGTRVAGHCYWGNGNES